MDNFKENLDAIAQFIAAKQKLGELAKKAETSLSTVYETFKVDNFDQLVGKKLDVYKFAIAMMNEIKSLPQQANEALK